jgi:hypothetical protein
MPIEFCRSKGVRVDRVLEAEILKHPKNLNKTIRIGYQYQLEGDSRWLHCDFKLDIIAKGKNKLTWIHKD